MASIADRGPDLFTRIDARLRMARVALAAAVSREARGEWPQDLAALAVTSGADLPTDPFNGEPFDYERRDDGTVRIAASAGADPDEPQLEWIAPR